MKTSDVLLGYEVGSGEEINIPIGHMVVTGMTQQAGKTSTLEALVTRSGLKAIAFITKRGERSFSQAHTIPPYFRESADWVFVSSLIDATLSEKNKLLRAWLMKVCRGTKTLAEVQRNVKKAKAVARGFSESIYTEIEGYLELVVPEIARLPPSGGIRLAPGLNVMDISSYSSAVQALVIRSAVEHVYENEQGVITVIPEAWEFLPELRGSPAKMAVQALIRKGGGLGNFMWIDSQDLAGVWKLALRAAPVYLIGIQREANEIKRTLANIPDSVAKPKSKDVATLTLGQFYACWGAHVRKVYVQPAWMSADDAQRVATGQIELEDVRIERVGGLYQEAEVLEPQSIVLEQVVAPEFELQEIEDMASSDEILAGINSLGEQLNSVTRTLKSFGGELQVGRVEFGPSPSNGKEKTLTETVSGLGDEDALWERFRQRLLADKVLINLALAVPEIDIEITRPVIRMTGDNLQGWIVKLIADGFLDQGATGYAVFKELERTGKKVAKITVYKALDTLAGLGALTKEGAKGDVKYAKAPDLKITKREV